MTDVVGERAKLAAQGLSIVTREQWGAVQSYTSRRDVEMPARGFVLHISVTQDPDDLADHEDDSMRAIERIGQERFGIGFPYNAAGFDTGRLYEGQPLTRRGAHTVNTREIAGFPRDMNYGWRALCLPQLVGDSVTDAQVDVAARWAAAQIRAGLAVKGASWSGHRDYAFKDCPGGNGYARIDDLNNLTRYYEAQGLEDDMGLTHDVTVAAVTEALVKQWGTPGTKVRQGAEDVLERIGNPGTQAGKAFAAGVHAALDDIVEPFAAAVASKLAGSADAAAVKVAVREAFAEVTSRFEFAPET